MLLDLEDELNKVEEVTLDMSESMRKIVRHRFPRAKRVIDRFHVQRLAFDAIQEIRIALRQIVHHLHLIKNREDWGYWIVSLIKWYEKYKDFVNEKTYYYSQTNRYWYTHKSVRRSFIHIKRALPNMFHYLDNQDIPKSTNGLESFFGHLKLNVSIHRGLSKEHYKNYIKWYLYFKSNENRFS